MDIVSTGQLKAQSLSIQVSTRTLCNGSCKCCISRLTPNTEGVEEKVRLCDTHGTLHRGFDIAARMGATHAILTGKAEPTQEHRDYIYDLIQECRTRGFLVDMHTNGFLLQPNASNYNLSWLVSVGLTMITFSIFHFIPEIHRQITGLRVDFEDLIRQANREGLLVRCSLVLTKEGVGTFDQVLKFIRTLGEFGAHMVVIRELWLPKFRAGKFNQEVYEWNKKNFVQLDGISNRFYQHSLMAHQSAVWEAYPVYELAPLPWGARVFTMEGCFSDAEHGVNITFARCEENDKGPVMKSIVHKPNGHGYRNWDSNANILY
jgi:MoaA/NifB/PqqE/SkfB family radical SAM enzyme